MSRSGSGSFVRVALVLPTEYAYARGVLRGIVAATRARNMYVTGWAGKENGQVSDEKNSTASRPWLFNVFRGIYGHSGRFLSRWFRDWNPDGIIGQVYGDPLAKVYRATRKPMVELFKSRKNSEFPRVLPDDAATGQMAARHFLERGFAHFAYFGAHGMLWSGEREAGFRGEIERTFAERAKSHPGMRKVAPAFTFSSFLSRPRERGRRSALSSMRERANAMGEWLRSLPKPVAVFAANDLWGSELVQAARESGLRVPDNVAVLGVDNEELLCELAHPPLSSIRIGGEQIGQAAVTLLERLMETPRRARGSIEVPRVAPVGIVTRQSTDVLAVEDPEVAAALQHIRLHCVEGLSVKQLLDAIPVNRRTLERRFISALGHTPLEEIRRMRLERAKALLQTGLTVYEVAQRAGFRTPEYLATSFLQFTGTTPTKYRRQFASRDLWEALPPSTAD